MSVISSGVLVVSGTTATDLEIIQEGQLSVLDEGFAKQVVLSDGGTAVVSSGGTLYICTISDGGLATVLESGFAQDVTLKQGGRFHVSSGAIAHHSIIESGAVQILFEDSVCASACVEKGGELDVKCGGFARLTDLRNGGLVHVSSGAMVASASICGLLNVDPGGYVSRSTVLDGGELRLLGEDATANRIAVSSGGALHASDGAVFFMVSTYAGAEAHLSGGCYAMMVQLNGGTLHVSDGANVTSMTVNAGGHLDVQSGGVAAYVAWTPCVGTVTVADGAEVMFTSAYSGVYCGSADTLLSSAASFESQSIGALETMCVFSGGTVSDLDVQSGGQVFVYGGGLTGKVTVAGGAEMTVNEGAELNFDLRRTSSGAGALVNDLSAIRGTPLYTLTVNGDLGFGRYAYSLADGAGDFSGSISAKNAGGEVLGALTPGEKAVFDGIEYLLILAGSELTLSVTVPDPNPPTVTDIRVTPDTPTNQDVLVTAVFSDTEGEAHGYYHLEGEEVWSDYLDGVVVTRNTTVYLKAVDTFGLESEVAEVSVTNIDKDPPVITLTADTLTPARHTTLTASTEPGVDMYYSRDGVTWTLYSGPIEVAENGAYEFTATDAVGNTGTAGIVFENIYPAAPQNPVGTEDRVSWDTVGANYYILEYSADGFEHGIRAATAGSAVDMFELPAGTYQWRVRADDSGEWATGDDIESGNEPGTAEVVRSDSDGEGDIFFATPDGVWDDLYAAMHAGSKNDWSGTGEIVSATGRGRIHNLYFGSDDLNVLYLTDGGNGDALFIDDAYTELPEGVTAQSRLAKIREIRAGAGNDIVDLTSQEFEYTGPGMTIRGGDGNDTIWANKGFNMLFGDAGNDRIAGASGADLIAGGTGDDSLHGGGGDDVFAFCADWGTDTVKQLATGRVTLWFVSGDDSHWDPTTMTYTDGSNSVQVTGVAAEQVALKFGSDGSDQYAQYAAAGAFDGFSSARIFEAQGGGILASL